MIQFEELFFSLDTANLHEVIRNNRVVFPVMETTFNHTDIEWSIPTFASLAREDRELLPCWGLVSDDGELFWKHPLSHLFGHYAFDREDESLLESRAYFNRDSSLSLYKQGSAWNGAVDWMVVSTTRQQDEDTLHVWCNGKCAVVDLSRLFIERPQSRAHIAREFGVGDLKLIIPHSALDWLSERVAEMGTAIVTAYNDMLVADGSVRDSVLTRPGMAIVAAQFMFGLLIPSPYLKTLLYAGLDAQMKDPKNSQLPISAIVEGIELCRELVEDSRFKAALYQTADKYLPPFWATNKPTI